MDTHMSHAKTTRIWEEVITIPTYPTPPPDPNPMFFEDRGNQGASGRIYPNPITDFLTIEGNGIAYENMYIGGNFEKVLDSLE